jgi:hypothetical protein
LPSTSTRPGARAMTVGAIEKTSLNRAMTVFFGILVSVLAGVGVMGIKYR